jgi:AcrR family transcriptional regulator
MSRPADPHAREALVSAARAEFARRGLRGARIEDITAACGLSKGSFYLHFESKEALFKELVDALMSELGGCNHGRLQTVETFLAENGPLTPEDFRAQTERFRRWDAIELANDLRSLEIMWRYRDVMDVLITGCQGTPFERTVWQMVDAEQARIAENLRRFQQTGCLRSDVEPDLFGAMVIGTYLLVGKRMASARSKPDLASMARGLQKLIREGSLPRGHAPHPPPPRDEQPPKESQGRPSPRRKIRAHAVRSTR